MIFRPTNYFMLKDFQNKKPLSGKISIPSELGGKFLLFNQIYEGLWDVVANPKDKGVKKRKKPIFVTMPIYNTIQKNKVGNKLIEAADLVGDEAGCILLGKDQNVYYRIIQEKDGVYFVVFHFVGKRIFAIESGKILFKDGKKSGIDFHFTSFNAFGGESEKTVGQSILLVVRVLAFMQVAGVELKHIDVSKNPKKGRKAVFGKERYLNRMDTPVNILDSSFFTTIVRTEGFTVGGDVGFPRKQRYGPERSLVKLIWIFPFSKNGYTRKAKIERGGFDE